MALPQENRYFNSNSHRKREVHEGGEDLLWTQNTPAALLPAGSCPCRG